MSKKLSLDSIIEGLEDVVNSAPVSHDIIKNNDSFFEPRQSIVGYINLAEKRIECDAEAEDLINYLVEFYLSGDILNNSYIKKRMDDDKARISGLLMNLKTTEHSIAKLIEVIDEGGAIVPRNFEVLAKLQSSMMEIVKHYEAVKTNIENNYKAMKVDYQQMYSQDDEVDSISGYGQRALLQNLSANMELGSEFIQKEKLAHYEDDEDDIEEEEFKLPKGVILYDESRIRASQEQKSDSESESESE